MASEANNTAPIDPIFKKGFEHGYWLKHGNSKDLNTIMQQAQKANPQYYEGLKGGQKEAEKEKFKDRLNDGLSNDKGQEMQLG